VKTPEIQNRNHSALELDEGFIPLAVLAVNGKSLIVQITPEVIEHLTGDKIEHACFLLRDAFYRVRPDLRRQ
jgi:hypothetical protein